MGKRFITSNNECEQIMKQTHSIHVCLIVFLIQYFDNWFAEVRQDSLHFDSITDPAHYESISLIRLLTKISTAAH